MLEEPWTQLRLISVENEKHALVAEKPLRHAPPAHAHIELSTCTSSRVLKSRKARCLRFAKPDISVTEEAKTERKPIPGVSTFNSPTHTSGFPASNLYQAIFLEGGRRAHILRAELARAYHKHHAVPLHSLLPRPSPISNNNQERGFPPPPRLLILNLALARPQSKYTRHPITELPSERQRPVIRDSRLTSTLQAYRSPQSLPRPRRYPPSYGGE